MTLPSIGAYLVVETYSSLEVFGKTLDMKVDNFMIKCPRKFKAKVDNQDTSPKLPFSFLFNEGLNPVMLYLPLLQ